MCVGRKRLLVAGDVVEDAICDDGKVLGQVQRSGDYEEGKEEEEYRVCRSGLVFLLVVYMQRVARRA